MKVFLQSRVLRPASAAKSGTMMAASENLAYGYNARSELVSAVSDTDANYNYAFDHIGNRATEAVAMANSESRISNYFTNNLNQYTEICSAEPNQQTAEPSNQLSSLQLSYAPFGNTTRTHRDSSASFDIVALNPFRFSSEYYDSELDLVYYNYRHYSPSLGRFLSRDPIQEQGGLNLYAFVGNNAILWCDSCGAAAISDEQEIIYREYISGGQTSGGLLLQPTYIDVSVSVLIRGFVSCVAVDGASKKSRVNWGNFSAKISSWITSATAEMLGYYVATLGIVKLSFAAEIEEETPTTITPTKPCGESSSRTIHLNLYRTVEIGIPIYHWEIPIEGTRRKLGRYAFTYTYACTGESEGER